jgi:hypothetical protein
LPYESIDSLDVNRYYILENELASMDNEPDAEMPSLINIFMISYKGCSWDEWCASIPRFLIWYRMFIHSSRRFSKTFIIMDKLQINDLNHLDVGTLIISVITFISLVFRSFFPIAPVLRTQRPVLGLIILFSGQIFFSDILFRQLYKFYNI